MKKIYLSQGRVALVDDADWEWLRRWKWFACPSIRGTYYARRSFWKLGKMKQVSMARAILGITDSKVAVDHRNGDTLDNRRENLRPATNAQNQANSGLRKNNTLGVKGVSYHPKRNRWQARIGVGGQRLSLGYFASVVEAAEAYRQKAIEVHGEFVKGV
jgi:hypothetical protein